jgi:hypothetical protein
MLEREYLVMLYICIYYPLSWDWRTCELTIVTFFMFIGSNYFGISLLFISLCYKLLLSPISRDN